MVLPSQCFQVNISFCLPRILSRKYVAANLRKLTMADGVLSLKNEHLFLRKLGIRLCRTCNMCQKLVQEMLHFIVDILQFLNSIEVNANRKKMSSLDL